MKIIRLFFTGLCLSAVLSCATTMPADTTAPIDRGVFSSDSEESPLVALNIHKFIKIDSIDKNKVEWDSPKQEPTRNQIVRLTPGVHVIDAYYSTGTVSTRLPMTVYVVFEEGQEYLIEGIVNGQMVTLEVRNTLTQESVRMDMDSLNGNQDNLISKYIKYILNPTMDSSNKIVVLENDNEIIYYKPDMIYTRTDKKTGKQTEGRRGFITDLSMKSGKTYLLETDISKMSREDFLENSHYEDISQIILIPLECSAAYVKYQYEKPEELKGQIVEYKIKITD